MSRGSSRRCVRELRRAYAWIAVLCGLLVAGAAAAADAARTYHNGGYDFDVAPAPAWAIARSVPATWDATAPGTKGNRWRYWLLDAQVDRRHGAHVRYYDRVLEPIAAELVGDAAKPHLAFSPDFQRLVLHRVELRRDGVWQNRLDPESITLARRESEFERDMATGVVSALVVLKDVRPGDLVRVTYSVVGDNPVLGDFIDEEFPFGADEPILDRHARVLFDPATPLLEHADAGAPKTQQVKTADALEWRAQAHGMAAIDDEGSYPVWYSPVPQLVVGVKRSWADVAAWARALYPEPQPLPADLEQRITAWRALDPDHALTAALRAVQEEVRYFGVEIGANTHKPNEPAETWTRRYGDCKDKARLLATILRRLDIDAQPALVSLSRGKAVADLPPAASAFDHVIVRVQMGDTTLWLDPTQTQQRGSPRLLAPAAFGVALPVGEGARDLATVAPPKGAVDRVRATERFTPRGKDATVALQIETEYSGAAANFIRRALQTAGNESVERNYLDFYRKRYGDVSKETPLSVQDDEDANTLRISERYLLKNPWVDANGPERALEVYADALNTEIALPHTAERRAPLPIRHPTQIEQRSEVEVPAGWRWMSEPSRRTLQDKAVSFDFAQQSDGKTISVLRRYETKGDVVTPDEFPEHFALLRQAGDLLGRRVVFGLAPADAAKQRDQRLKNLMRDLMDDAHKSKSGQN